jgi:hypothetical protein
MKRIRKLTGMALLLAVGAGCEHSSLDDLRQVEANLHAHYKMRKRSSTKLSVKEKRIRLERLRMQFGDVVE